MASLPVSAIFAGNPRRIVVIDPGHPHASGVQSARIKGVSDTVLVFAPEGPELREYLQAIEKVNKRKKNPTSWMEQVYTGKDYLKKVPKARKGDFVVLAGKNSKKPDYILSCIKKGYNIFSDKPMVVDGKGYRKLEKAYAAAGKKGLLMFDEMTERYNTYNILCRDILSMKDAVGEISSYYIFDVHHYYKKSGNHVTLRPAWFFDVREQGEGIADVSTHFVDLAMWQCSPDVPVTRDRVSGISGSHFPTVITPEQFEKVSGEKAFPEFLSPYVRDGRLEVNSNGTLQFNIDAIPVKLDIEWRYGNDMTRDIFRQEIRCASAVIRMTQDETTSNVRKMTVETSEAGSRLIAGKLSQKYPWVSLEKVSDGVWEVAVDSKKAPSKMGGGAATVARFLNYLDGEPMPDWESVNTLTKYHITTSAVESLR